MAELADMVWIEMRKAIRSRMPLWTTLGSLFMPLGIAILFFLAKNPELSRKLGLISAKANLVAYSATDWHAYLVLFAEIISAGGFFFFIISMSWIFGREFADGTLKDMLAVPVRRSSILLAKFIVTVIWSIAMAFIMLVFGLVVGVLLQLPGGSSKVILQGIAIAGFTSCLVIAAVLPFSLFASLGRGYILPMAMSVLTLITASLMIVVGWAEYFPWAVSMLYAQGDTALPMASYGILLTTSVVGCFATYFWWKYADQNR